MSGRLITIAKDQNDKTSVLSNNLKIKNYSDFIDYFNSSKRSYKKISLLLTENGVVEDILFNYSSTSYVKERLFKLKNQNYDMSDEAKYNVEIDGTKVFIKQRKTISSKILNESLFTAINKYELIAIQEYLNKNERAKAVCESSPLFKIGILSIFDIDSIVGLNEKEIKSIEDCFLISNKSLEALKENLRISLKRDVIKNNLAQNLLNLDTFQLRVSKI